MLLPILVFSVGLQYSGAFVDDESCMASRSARGLGLAYRSGCEISGITFPSCAVLRDCLVYSFQLCVVLISDLEEEAKIGGQVSASSLVTEDYALRSIRTDGACVELV